jgi:hypothetical protein
VNRTASLPVRLLTSAVLAFAVRAQTPATTATKTTLQVLEAMKVENASVIQRQAALLLKLDELQKEAAQIKFLAKRG